jgi:two-component system cell cycle response regulator CtrA
MDLRAGAAELRLGCMEVVVHGRAVALTPKEYAILELLFLRRGVVHAKPAIVNHVYGAEEGPALRTLDVIVCKLRKKLAAHGAPELVATVWGSGLTLRDVPEHVTAEAANDARVDAGTGHLLVAV